MKLTAGSEDRTEPWRSRGARFRGSGASPFIRDPQLGTVAARTGLSRGVSAACTSASSGASPFIRDPRSVTQEFVERLLEEFRI